METGWVDRPVGLRFFNWPVKPVETPIKFPCIQKNLALPGILALFQISLRVEVAQISDFLVYTF